MREHECGKVEQHVCHRHDEGGKGIVPYGCIGETALRGEQRAHHKPQKNERDEREQSVDCRQPDGAGQQPLAPSHVSS